MLYIYTHTHTLNWVYYVIPCGHFIDTIIQNKAFSHICIYIYIYIEREREREREITDTSDLFGCAEIFDVKKKPLKERTFQVCIILSKKR